MSAWSGSRRFFSGKGERKRGRETELGRELCPASAQPRPCQPSPSPSSQPCSLTRCHDLHGHRVAQLQEIRVIPLQLQLLTWRQGRILQGQRREVTWQLPQPHWASRHPPNTHLPSPPEEELPSPTRTGNWGSTQEHQQFVKTTLRTCSFLFVCLFCFQAFLKQPPLSTLNQ